MLSHLRTAPPQRSVGYNRRKEDLLGTAAFLVLVAGAARAGIIASGPGHWSAPASRGGRILCTEEC